MLLNYTTKSKMSPTCTLLLVGNTRVVPNCVPQSETLKKCSHLPLYPHWGSDTGDLGSVLGIFSSQSLKDAFNAKLGKEAMKLGI